MNLYRKLINKPYIFQQITGLSPKEFAQIIKKLRPIWRRKHLKKKKIEGRPYGVGDLNNQLLCLLMYYRTYATQLFIGFWFRVDDATISRSIKRLEPLLAKVMEIKKEPKVSEKRLKKLLLDATEQRCTGSKKRKSPYYSGKKRAHTIKTEIIVTEESEIIQVSEPFPGSVHDIKIRRESDPIPDADKIYADGAYRGLEKEYPHILVPRKKPPGKPFSQEDKSYNNALHMQRIGVEWKFRELKIFKILSHVYRNSKGSYAVKMAIIAGIVNLKNGF